MATRKPRPAQARPFALQRTGDRMLDTWLTATNPLAGLSITSAQGVFDAARRGDTRYLQWLYQEMEAAMPLLMVCAERRSAALANIDWQIRQRKPTRARAFDQTLADEQSAALEQAFGDAEQTNLGAAVEHLAGGFFRGFAHVAPLWGFDGALDGFDLLPGYAFSRDLAAGTWMWHRRDAAAPEPIPEGELCSLVRSRHIDYPAMAICLRMGMGEKKWGQFVERYGIPPVILVMPQDIPTELRGEYRAAAERVADGGSGALPAGSIVNYAGESRGVDPFTSFLEHQNQMLVLMATGGMLTSLTGATGIGDGTSNAHEATWESIVGRDAVVVGDAINRDVAGQILDRAFPGRPHLAQFILEREEAPSAAEVFDAAGKAVAAGYVVNQAQLEERTGYRLERAPQPTLEPGLPPLRLQNSEGDAATRRTVAGKARENAGGAAGGKTGGEGPSPASERILEAAAEEAAETMAEMILEAQARAAARKEVEQ